mgnify:CR=1 FL=1
MERWDTLWPGGWTFCFGDGAFKPSTDSFLLGSFPPLRRSWRVCDLGAGTGLLGLLLLAREPSLTVTGLELSPAACALAERTAAANGLTGRLVTLPCDLRERQQLPQAGTFDLAVSNPPYFPAGGGKTALGSRGDARSELTCTMAQLCGAASYLLRSGGQFCLVYRPELLETLRRYRLEPKVLRFVQKNGVSAPSLVLLACRKDGRTGLTVQPPLLLQNADGTETEELRRIYFKDKG